MKLKAILENKHMELLLLLGEKKQKPPSAHVVEIGSSTIVYLQWHGVPVVHLSVGQSPSVYIGLD